MRLLLVLTFLSAAAFAQETAAPTPQQAGSGRGDNTGNYNIVNSIELGYRFASVGGNDDTYRSNVNFGNGIRLLGSTLTVNSRNGHGSLFDEIVLTTQGLGNDPYQSAILRVQKNRLYRYDLTWRQNDYFNPGLRSDGAEGVHLLDTSYAMQDQNLTLFPESNVKFFLGYSRSAQSGPAITTVPGVDSENGNTFPVFARVRRRQNEYRVGNEFKVFGLRVNWMRGWQDFKDDTPVFLSPLPGSNPPGTALTSFNRSAPYHGTSPYWRANLFAGNRWMAFNGRFTYTSGQRAFVLDESSVGLSGSGAANNQIVTLGNAQRPVATGNVSLSFFPVSKLSIVNTTSIYNVRTEGDSTYVQFDNFAQTVNYQAFQYLGIKTFSNETGLNYAWTKWLTLFAGYHYTDRQIRSILFQAMTPYSQTNDLHAGVFGFHLRPVQGLSIAFDGEVGRASQPFAAASERNYHDLTGRVEYRKKSMRLSASTRANYNINSVSLSSYSSRARTYSANAAWTPNSRLSFDAGYTKQHLNSLAGIAYFAAGQSVTGEDSLYISNLHIVNLGMNFGLAKRVDLYLAYNRIQDTGDGRATLLGSENSASLDALRAAQTFPVTFHAPLARLSFKLTERIRWNAGYEYYGYHEQFYAADNYRAHTGYTSLSWSF